MDNFLDNLALNSNLAWNTRKYIYVLRNFINKYLKKIMARTMSLSPSIFQ